MAARIVRLLSVAAGRSRLNIASDSVPGPRSILCLAFFLAIAAAVRLVFADYSLWFDEWMSLLFAKLPLSQLWGTWMVHETNPPLYYTAVKAWTGAIGTSPFSLRVLSVIAGTLSIAVLTACSFMIWRSWAALTTCIVCTLSSQHVFYSTVARGYIFVLLFFAISLAGILLLFRTDPNKRQWYCGLALYVTGSVLAIYCHTTMLLWPVAAALTVSAFLAIDQSTRFRLISWIGVNVILAILAGWWIYITLLQIDAGAGTVSWIHPVSPAVYVSLLRQHILLFSNNVGLLKLSSYLIALIVIASITFNDRRVRLVAALFFTSIAVFFLAGLFKPIILPRTIFWMSGFTALLVSASIAQIRQFAGKGGALVLLSGLLLVDLWSVRNTFETENWAAFLPFADAHSDTPIVVLSAGSQAVASLACQTQFGRPCPVRFIRVAGLGAAPSTTDLFRTTSDGRNPHERSLQPGQAFILRTAGDIGTYSPSSQAEATKRSFGSLELYGPLSLDPPIIGEEPTGTR